MFTVIYLSKAYLQFEVDEPTLELLTVILVCDASR